jgi:hypothetical protein
MPRCRPFTDFLGRFCASVRPRFQPGRLRAPLRPPSEFRIRHGYSDSEKFVPLLGSAQISESGENSEVGVLEPLQDPGQSPPPLFGPAIPPGRP